MEGYKNILANKFMRDTNYIIIKDTDSLEDLEYQWNKFLSNMTTRQQRLSDDKSIEIWNMTNQQHYMDLKIRLSNGENKDVESTAQDAEDWQEVPEYMFSKIPENDIDRFNLDDTIQEGRIPLNYDVKFVARTETQDNIERAEKICAETNINMIIMYKGDSIKDKLEDLEQQYEKWRSQSFDLQRKSDDMCREIFKMTNIDRYNKFKAELVSNLPSELSTYQLRIADQQEHIDSSMTTIRRLAESVKTSDLDYKEQILTEACKDVKAAREAHIQWEKENGGDPDEDWSESMKKKTTKNESFVTQCYAQKIIKEAKEQETLRKIKRLNDTPYFTPLELIDMGVHNNHNYYSGQCDNDGLTKDISAVTWFDNYYDRYMNHVFEDYTKEWIDKLNELYSDFDEIKKSQNEEKILARKQSILDLGWNPEIPFTIENRNKATERVNKIRNKEVPDDEFINIDRILDPNQEYLQELSMNIDYEPVFLVLTKGHTPVLSDAIRAVTKCDYTHASISFDPFLKTIYSFNITKNSNGLARETLDSFKTNFISVYAFFAEKETIAKMKANVEDFASHKNSYDVKILATKLVGLDKKVGNNYEQVCSTFVDTILKSGNVNLTGKVNLAAPSDIYHGVKSKPNKIFEIYSGIAPKYDGHKISRKLEALRQNASTKGINESYTDFIEEKYDHMYNMNKWESGECKILFITGVSGSGKSTLAENIAKDYNAKLISMDHLTILYLRGRPSKNMPSNSLIYKYIDDIGGIENLYTNCRKKDWEPAMEDMTEMTRFYEWCIDYSKKHNERLVVEGSHILHYQDPSFFKQYPIIVKILDPKTNIQRRAGREIFSDSFKQKDLADKAAKVNNFIQYMTLYFPRDHYKLRKFNRGLNESFDIINEVKKFPVEFDEDGNLTIYKCKTGNISYGDEIDESSELLKTYKNTNDEEGTKYELAKLWYIMSAIEKEMSKKDIKKERYEELARNRNTANTIFKQYFTYICQVDKGFNFSEYYNSTPFSDNAIKITNSTIRYSLSALKKMII